MGAAISDPDSLFITGKLRVQDRNNVPSLHLWRSTLIHEDSYGTTIIIIIREPVLQEERFKYSMIRAAAAAALFAVVQTLDEFLQKSASLSDMQTCKFFS